MVVRFATLVKFLCFQISCALLLTGLDIQVADPCAMQS